MMGDNGASGEGTLHGLANEVGVAANGVEESIPYLLSIMDELGGPTTYNHYPVGWAHAMDTPFQWTKQVASHFGGTRNGLVISWPKRIKQTGEVRSQFSSVIDIVPTILEAAGVKEPTMINGVKQTPIEGTSLVYSFDDAKAPTRHTTQYFELLANRGVYDDGWMANTTPLASALGQGHSRRAESQPGRLQVGAVPRRRGLLAGEQPRRAESRQAQGTAGGVRPRGEEVQRLSARCLVCRTRRRVASPEPDARAQHVHLLSRARPRSRRRRAGHEEQGLHASRRRWRFRKAGPKASSSRRAGVSAAGDCSSWTASRSSTTRSPISSSTSTASPRTKSWPPASTRIKFDFKYDGPGYGKGGTGTLSVDGKQVAQGKIERTIPVRFSLDETFDVGEDTGTPVVEDYVTKMPFEFTGELKKVVIELGKSGLTASDEKKLEESKEKLAAVRD